MIVPFICSCASGSVFGRVFADVVIRYAMVLGFDVEPNTEAKKMAEKLGVKIFTANIIYHLEQRFKTYIDEIREEERRKVSSLSFEALHFSDLRVA